MKTRPVLLLIFLLCAANGLTAQHMDKKKKWDCQYLMTRDSANRIVMENLQGIGSIQFDGDTLISITMVCNTGETKIKFAADSSFRIAEVSTTKLHCDQQYKETTFIKYLKLSTEYEINKKGLKLFFNNRKEYLFFVVHI